MSKTKNVVDILIYVLIFALFVCPLMIPYSYFPVSKFYSELTVLVIAATLSVLMICRSERVAISSCGIASFLFAIFLILQIATNHIRFPGINLAVAFEFIVATMLSIGVASFIDGKEEMQQKLVSVIVWAVLAGTTLQVFYGLLQFTGVAANFKNFILYVGSEGMDVFGNIGQKNDYVDFITLGVFALAYLFFIRRINLLVFVVYSTFFLSIITITTSRTCFVYFLFAFIMTLIYVWINRKHPERKLHNKQIFVIISGLFVGLLLVEAFLPAIIDHFIVHATTGTGLAANSASVQDISSGLYRFGTKSLDQATYRRFYEWYKDIIIFIHNPIFGIGWYQYPREAIYLMETNRFMYIPANQALYTHSHNSPLNILAETGVIGFAIVMVYGFGYSLYRMFKNFDNYATLFISFMILTIFGQSLFQYPLWYSYFLIYFVLLLSLDKPIYVINNSRAKKLIVLIIFLGCVQLFEVGAITYNRLVSYTIVPQDADDFTRNVLQLQNMVDNNLLWSFPALMVLDNYIMPTSPQTDGAMSRADQLRYIDMMGSELPYSGAIYKQIIIHKIIGDNAGALRYSNLLAHAYPFWKGQMAAQLQNSPEFADDVAALNQFKYEDKSIFAKILNKDKK